MPEIVTDCPRCGAQKTTFDVKQGTYLHAEHNWKRIFEAYSVCRNCNKGTILIVEQKQNTSPFKINTYNILEVSNSSLAPYVDVRGFINLKDNIHVQPPEHLPPHIDEAFREGTTCLSVACYNAAGTMFRLCLDFATKEFLPKDNEGGLNDKIRRSLGWRLDWLFNNEKLPKTMRELSTCIKDDGNDGAHEGILSKEDAEDILDFTTVLLERLYTEPRRLEIARERRETRRRKD